MNAVPPPKDLIPLSAPDPVPQLLRDLLHEKIGVFVEKDRLDTLLEKLEGRARAHGCASYLDYYYILKYEEKGPDEWRRVMDAFSVQETYFWREFDQVRALVDAVIPAWFKRRSTPLRIWSAACATGEEPYTLAMAIAEAGWSGHPIEIQASDASEAALEKARGGLYRERSFRALPPGLRAKYFEPKAGGFAIAPEITARVTFRWANLMAPLQIADLASSEVIFCRNVFIYFSPAAISRVVASFAQHMPDEGKLFVGSSESLLKLTGDFSLEELVGAFVYVRKSRLIA
jgi:chemotaxis protein methyltransferase CheR